MNFDQIQLFLRVAHTHNISLAGQELDLSPAVASSYINKLESSLGTRLLHRTTRKVSLTEDGAAFLPFAEDVIASVDAASASLGKEEHSLRGTLRVSAPASFGRMHLIPAMSAFLDTHPNLHVDCRLSDNIVDLVEGGFDVAIRNAPLKNSSFVARKLADDHRIVCASPDYIKKHGAPETPTSLKNHECIVLPGLETWQFNSEEGKQSVRVKGKFRADNGEVVRDACVKGMGITICSRWIAYQQIKAGTLVEVLSNYELISDTAIWGLYPSSRQLSLKVRKFIDSLVDYFQKWEETLACS